MTVYDDPVVCTTAGALPADMVPKATASAHSRAPGGAHDCGPPPRRYGPQGHGQRAQHRRDQQRCRSPLDAALEEGYGRPDPPTVPRPPRRIGGLSKESPNLHRSVRFVGYAPFVAIHPSPGPFATASLPPSGTYFRSEVNAGLQALWGRATHREAISRTLPHL